MTIICDDADLPAIVAAGPWRAKRTGCGTVAIVRGRKRQQRLGPFLFGSSLANRLWHKNGSRLDFRRENVELLSPGEILKRAGYNSWGKI